LTPRITNAGLIYLRGLDKLELLHLDGHDIGDDGLASFLSELKALKQLDIARTQVSDESIECIAGLKSLKTLVITDTDITDAGANRLKERLPHCYIQR
jgi:Leucine-rich repeat (LRR) protein